MNTNETELCTYAAAAAFAAELTKRGIGGGVKPSKIEDVNDWENNGIMLPLWGYFERPHIMMNLQYCYNFVNGKQCNCGLLMSYFLPERGKGIEQAWNQIKTEMDAA